MKRLANLLLVLLLIPLELLAQTDTHPTIVRAYALEQQGQLAQAIALLRPLVDSGAFQGAQLGRAWTVLGLAYTHQGAFSSAQHAFEQAISTLRPLPQSVQDYASALDDLGSLYAAMGQFETATDLRLRTLHLYEQIGNHSGIARVCNNLAGLALRKRDLKRAGKYLKRLAEEMKVATALNDDDLAAIYSIQASFAGENGNSQAAVSGYEHAMQVWKRAHKGDHPNIGWGCMLLGGAYADAGRLDDAATEMQQGLSILDRTLGRANPEYLQAEIAYSRLLDETGDHDAASRLRAADEAILKTLNQRQCVGCTISVDALR